MLILSRRCAEEIVINDQVTVKVIHASGGRVKLGVSAPPDVAVRRCSPTQRLDLDCGPVLLIEAESSTG